MPLNFAKFIQDSTLAAGVKIRIIESVVYINGYTDTVQNEAGETTPNPITKVQFFNQEITRYLRESIKAYETKRDVDTTRQAKSAEVDSLNLG